MKLDEQSISDLLKRLRAGRANQSLPNQADLVDFKTLAGLVHIIDGLSFRQHFGEVLLYLLNYVDSIPGEGDRQSPDLSSKPTATSAPVPQSNPKTSSVVNPVFNEPSRPSNPSESSAPSTSSKPMENSAPVTTSKPSEASAPSSTSNPSDSSNLFCVRTTQFWACDNTSCGHDDLVMELQMPGGKRKTEQIRYQCLKCTFIGTAELTKEEIAKAMKEEKRVEFEINKTNVFDFLNQPRPAAAKKRKSKDPDPQPGEPKGTPLIDAIAAGDQHMTQIAQEVLQSRSVPATQSMPAPSQITAAAQSPEAQTPQPPAIQSGKTKSKKGGTADATPFQASQAPGAGAAGAVGPSTPGTGAQETPAAVKKAVEKVITAQVSPSEVVSEEMMKTLTSTVSAWPLERLIKEWETMTGKVYKQGVTIPDAMVTEIVFQLAGVPMST